MLDSIVSAGKRALDEAVLQLLRSSDKPLTIPEIAANPDIAMLVQTSNPKNEISRCIKASDMIAVVGHGKYTANREVAASHKNQHHNGQGNEVYIHIGWTSIDEILSHPYAKPLRYIMEVIRRKRVYLNEADDEELSLFGVRSKMFEDGITYVNVTMENLTLWYNARGKNLTKLLEHPSDRVFDIDWVRRWLETNRDVPRSYATQNAILMGPPRKNPYGDLGYSIVQMERVAKSWEAYRKIHNLS